METPSPFLRGTSIRSSWTLAPSNPSVGLAWGLAILGAVAVVALRLPGVVAMGLGAVLGLALRPDASRVAGGLGGRLLKLSVVATGAGLNLGFVLRVGVEGIGSTVVTLGTALGLGALLTRRLGVPRDVGLLVTVGTAICGGSAVAAAAPALRARGEDTGVALAVVFALNGVALVLFPALGQALGLEPLDYGRWCALAIHDTSSVVGAAASFGPEALELATVTKLGRALWIVPIVTALAVAPHHGGTGTRDRSGAGEDTPTRAWLQTLRAVPPFLVAFVALSGLCTVAPPLRPAGAGLADLGRIGLTLSLYGVGLGTDVAALRRGGARALLLGGLLWLVLSGLSLALAVA